eukprot:TRINITY_DN9998_c0_g1_i5.p1 TRINITY_DN9998_c0_g1~~TRINITY_DN9998_c0_g1_i5.p1  ORF type:complete len:178 (+),score=8.70 TRINITY_DN9998_c0_g1_i5:65-598(+)
MCIRDRYMGYNRIMYSNPFYRQEQQPLSYSTASRNQHQTLNVQTGFIKSPPLVNRNYCEISKDFQRIYSAPQPHKVLAPTYQSQIIKKSYDLQSSTAQQNTKISSESLQKELGIKDLTSSQVFPPGPQMLFSSTSRSNLNTQPKTSPIYSNMPTKPSIQEVNPYTCLLYTSPSPRDS